MKKTSNNSHSRSVNSTQLATHEKLAATVLKHLRHPFRKPYAPHNLSAFAEADTWLSQQQRPLILDSFCGVGESSRELARLYPDCAVIGVDKSAHRIAKHSREDNLDNYLLIRADVEDFWRLAVDAGWQPLHHYLLYPNPWPKPSQLKYRVQGSAVFPALLSLGGALDLRSNWQIYVAEFQQALVLAGQHAVFEAYKADPPITPFERKYSISGQALWRCTCSINSSTP